MTGIACADTVVLCVVTTADRLHCAFTMWQASILQETSDGGVQGAQPC